MKGEPKKTNHRRLMAGSSLIIVLFASLILLPVMLQGTRYVTLVMLAWLTGLSMGFLMIALKPTKSLEIYHRAYAFAQTREVLVCLVVVICTVVLEINTLNRFLPEFDLPFVLLAILVAGVIGTAVYYLGKKSV